MRFVIITSLNHNYTFFVLLSLRYLVHYARHEYSYRIVRIRFSEYILTRRTVESNHETDCCFPSSLLILKHWSLKFFSTEWPLYASFRLSFSLQAYSCFECTTFLDSDYSSWYSILGYFMIDSYQFITFKYSYDIIFKFIFTLSYTRQLLQSTQNSEVFPKKRYIYFKRLFISFS